MAPREGPADEAGAPLAETTFCVLDLETTGGAPPVAAITEIGAVKVRGGEVLGEFQTLVDPGRPIPRAVTALTGITDAAVAGAPALETVLGAFLAFLGDAVVVAHNAGFDLRFLRNACRRLGSGRLANPVVCTARLARRLVRDEVPDLRLATLARALRTRTEPCHRALPDARAAADVFHALLERAARFGVTCLDDLLWFQSAGGHPQAAKRRLLEGLPRAPGVYVFRDVRGEVLYVGKASNVRARVCGYFSSDDRRRVGDLLRELHAVDHLVIPSDLCAAVVEARLIRRHRPRYNRAGRAGAAPAFLRLTAERFPRLAVARRAGPGALGPLGRRAAELGREALEEATRLRRCADRIGERTRFAPCMLAEVDRCPAPCDGRTSPEEYAPAVARAARALAGDPTDVLASLGARLERLAAAARFEEAASLRDRLGALVGALIARRDVAALVGAGRVVIADGGSLVEIRDGLVASLDGAPLPVPADAHPDEPRLVASWLARHADRAPLVEATGPWALPAAGGVALAAWRRRLAAAERSRAGERPPVERPPLAGPGLSGPGAVPRPSAAARAS
jgi:DNA polymerase-3 subunit epsilon